MLRLVWVWYSWVEGTLLPQIERTVMLIAGITIIALVSMQIGLRFLGASLGWPGELARLSMVWGALMAVPLLFREGKILQIDVLFRIFPSSIQKIGQFLIYLMVSVFAVYITWLGYQTFWARFERYSGALRWPMSWWTLPYAIMSLFIVVHLVRMMVLVFAADPSDDSHND